MAIDTAWYEVSVSVPIKGSRHYSAHGHKSTMQNIGSFVERTIVKTFNIEAKTPKQAMKRCEKHGHVISAVKTDVCERDDIVNRCRDIVGLPPNPYPNAISMGEFVWQRKEKRAERLVNKELDKPVVD